ncbi:F-box family [Galdieria sulphuraria]|uniref:F-box family n=1 Tax=Galdieria sulphuraria TaxID=130081 RepID=M2XT51_GALSU|nr:F-box family [Galdieria sulphuraria]EME26619.1 F-box family [Galdieria sulphuraria]|eukprot:XP_005703139.1 F-box family [Galdieria sulphuraria]
MQKEQNTSYGEGTPLRGCADRVALEAIFPRVCFPHRRQSSRRVPQRPLFFRHFRRIPENQVSTLEQLQEAQPCLNECCESNLDEEGLTAPERRVRDCATSSQYPPLTLGNISQSGVVEHSPIDVNDVDCTSREKMDLESCDLSYQAQRLSHPYSEQLSLDRFLHQRELCEDREDESFQELDETQFVESPDSVSFILSELQGIVACVDSKPSLATGSCSFIRDRLRTLLVVSSSYARQNQSQLRESGSVCTESDSCVCLKKHWDSTCSSFLCLQPFSFLPDDIVRLILRFLEADDLGRARRVCKKWYEFCSDESLWKEQCLSRWRSLEWDESAWALVTGDMPLEENYSRRWMLLFPRLNQMPYYCCRLQKTGRFICNLRAHQFGGNPLIPYGLGQTLIVERRFNISHLETFVLPDAARFYFEPETREDEEGYFAFIEYLLHRNRAGLALEGERRIIFIPPCDYSSHYLQYSGKGLVGIVQRSYPPLS